MSDTTDASVKPAPEIQPESATPVADDPIVGVSPTSAGDRAEVRLSEEAGRLTEQNPTHIAGAVGQAMLGPVGAAAFRYGSEAWNMISDFGLSGVEAPSAAGQKFADAFAAVTKGMADAVKQTEDPVMPPEAAPDIPSAPDFTGEGYSEIPGVRSLLEDSKVDPDKLNGVGITIFDHHKVKETRGDNSSDEEEEQVSHGTQVGAVVNDAEHGLIRGAKLTEVERDAVKYPDAANYADKPGGLNQYITDSACEAMNSLTTQIQRDFLDNGDPSTRVVNFSVGMTNSILYQKVFGEVSRNPEKYGEWIEQLVGKEKAQEWQQSLKDHPLSEEPTPQSDKLDGQILQAIANHVDELLANNKDFKAANEGYRKVTKELADKGVTLVVAAGNHQNDLQKFHLDLKPGYGYNWYAQSDHVISVGASDISKTPLDRTDDRITSFSSHGTDNYHPTVVTQGRQLNSRWDGIAGTSVAAPQVTGAIALMLAQNPKMTFSEIKAGLEGAATKIEGVSTNAQGAGILNIDRAVIAARK